MRHLVAFGLVVWFSSSAWAFDQAHAKWADILEKYTTPSGKFAYKRLKADLASAAPSAAPFPVYLTEISEVKTVEFNKWPRPAQLAFFINAYNALTVKLVLDHYPLTSIKNVGGLLGSPWKTDFFSLFGGAIKNLENLEHNYLDHFEEPRLHTALYSATVSGARLQPLAFLSDGLSDQLDNCLREFLSTPGKNKYEPARGGLYLSKIFDWSGDDFEKMGGYIAILQKYGPPEAQEAIKNGGKVRFLTFDWSLDEE